MFLNLSKIDTLSLTIPLISQPTLLNTIGMLCYTSISSLIFENKTDENVTEKIRSAMDYL